ncbi:MAG: zinc-binding dehydrogenase [Desulfurococcales archaeon]|nr:zinc-binding dehydrogenase [Desulfurococcales archaeon]
MDIPDIPTKHRAALLREFGKPLSIEYIDTPIPSDYGVLLKVISAGICHSDIHLWAGDYRPIGIPKSLPWMLSHEIVGIVVGKGDKVPESIGIGSKMLVYAWQYAEEDKYTLSGYTQLAKKRARLTIDVPNGGLQEYIYVQHYRFTLNIDDLSDPQAASPLACAGLTTYNAVKKARQYIDPDDYVLVVGLGGLGSYAVQWVRRLMPYTNLIVADVREEAIDFASKLAKIDAAINPSKEDPVKALFEITRGEGVKAVLDIVGLPQTINTYIKAVAKLGIYVIIGLMGYEAPIPVHHIVRNEVKIVGNYTGSLRDQLEVLELARRGLINYRDVISKRYRFEEVNEAIGAVASGKHLGRVIVIFG